MSILFSLRSIVFRLLTAVGIFSSLTIPVSGQSSTEVVPIPADLPAWHLTAEPWQAQDVSVDEILETVTGLCRFMAQHVDEQGAVIDPFLQREHQYSTPYFAAAVGVLMHFDRAEDLWPTGIRAMEHATRCLAGGHETIPDRHGEFFLAPLASVLVHYRDHVPEETLQRWTQRMRTPVTEVMENQHGRFNNWRTYAMKGEWIRSQLGLADRSQTLTLISDAWLHHTQRSRMVSDRLSFYQDWSVDPQSLAVEAVGRGNLLALLEAGYNGIHQQELQQLVETGSHHSLLWQDASGQCPPNGRTDNHVFNDVLYQLIFDVMAERCHRQGRSELAGRFRQAADLSFRSIRRWQRDDAPWNGSFYVTKNHFPPDERVGYQPASQYGNYNGAVMYHLAEAALARRSAVRRQPAPVEVGGYVQASDAAFGSVTAAAGGMQLNLNLRGDSVPKYGKYWSPLGLTRISRTRWDSRLGPSDGVYDAETGEGVTLAPVWKQGARWVRVSDWPEHYRGSLQVEFVHPLLVRFRVLYHTITGQGGPAFTQKFVLTPDGLLTEVVCHQPVAFGLTCPVLVDDGRPLNTTQTDRLISVAGPDGSDSDSQNFLCLSQDGDWHNGEELLSTYGWLQPVRLSADQQPVRLMVYPYRAGDIPAQHVLDSWQGDLASFRSELGRVTARTYVGRTSAGGQADQLDINDDGHADLSFSRECQFLVQLDGGRVTAIEADRSVEVRISASVRPGKSPLPLSLSLQPWSPRRLSDL